jgi:hypothetical protein
MAITWPDYQAALAIQDDKLHSGVNEQPTKLQKLATQDYVEGTTIAG